uniref:CCHC-type domain-containing protein n=1 Tax=Tanacetum cinerariifolium TaxID=118510 RepID=A0A699GWV3_TANCI|nr:hypothetical protein [Tanacetum cinerariifolium]
MVPFEQQDDDLKKNLAKNNEAKRVLYNALPKKEYERNFMCKTAKDIDNQESIDSGFARFNTIITSLKALDEGFSSKNYVRKFLRGLHPKWRAKVTTIEESKDLGKKERVKSIALKAKKDSSDDETSTSESDDGEYAMAKRKSDWKCFRCDDPNHLIGDCPKPSRNIDQKAIIGGSWSDSKNDAEDKTNDETCLMAQSSNEVTLNSSHYNDNASSLDNDSMQIEYDILCEISLKTINKNKILKTKRDILEKEILELNEKIKKLERSKEIETASEKGIDGSTIKVHESTLPGSMSRIYGQKRTKHVFSPPMSSRTDLVITRKKLIHNNIDESKKPSLKPSPKTGICYVQTDSRRKIPPPRRNIPSQPR